MSRRSLRDALAGRDDDEPIDEPTAPARIPANRTARATIGRVPAGG